MCFNKFDCLLSRAHIKRISFTCFVYFEPCTNLMWPAFTLVSPFSFFYKVNLILLQKYQHVTTVRVGI